jgi:hypothetical protein
LLFFVIFAIFAIFANPARCVFGQNAAGYQLVGLLTIAAAIAVLLFVSATALRVVGWIALPIGAFWYVIMGHALIYGPFLWAALLRALMRPGGPKQ